MKKPYFASGIKERERGARREDSRQERAFRKLLHALDHVCRVFAPRRGYSDGTARGSTIISVPSSASRAGLYCYLFLKRETRSEEDDDVVRADAAREKRSTGIGARNGTGRERNDFSERPSIPEPGIRTHLTHAR